MYVDNASVAESQTDISQCIAEPRRKSRKIYFLRTEKSRQKTRKDIFSEKKRPFLNISNKYPRETDRSNRSRRRRKIPPKGQNLKSVHITRYSDPIRDEPPGSSSSPKLMYRNSVVMTAKWTSWRTRVRQSLLHCSYRWPPAFLWPLLCAAWPLTHIFADYSRARCLRSSSAFESIRGVFQSRSFLFLRLPSTVPAGSGMCSRARAFTSAWVAQKDLSWTKSLNVLELSNFHRTLSFRTFDVKTATIISSESHKTE